MIKFSIILFLALLICVNAASTTEIASAVESTKDESTGEAPDVEIAAEVKESASDTTEGSDDSEVETDPKSDLVLSNFAVDSFFDDHHDKCKKKKKCYYKKKCYKKDCHCYYKKRDCNCYKAPYKCCDYKYTDCNCHYKSYECHCKQYKYICGYNYGHYPSHVSIPADAHWDSHHGKYKTPVYCYKHKCETCKKYVCDKCKKYYCDTCYKKKCDTCKKEVCKTCKKCKKVLVKCKYFKKCYH